MTVHALEHDRAGSSLLAAHPRAGARGSWVVDASHWDGLPDGHSRATVIELPRRNRRAPCPPDRDDAPLAALLAHRRGGDVTVAHRPLTAYQTAADTNSADQGLTP